MGVPLSGVPRISLDHLFKHIYSVVVFEEIGRYDKVNRNFLELQAVN